MNERANDCECVYTGSRLGSLGKRRQVTGTGGRRCLLSIPPPATERACVSLAVVSRRGPSHHDVAVQNGGTPETGFCSAVRDLVGQAAPGAALAKPVCRGARSASHLPQAERHGDPPVSGKTRPPNAKKVAQVQTQKRWLSEADVKPIIPSPGSGLCPPLPWVIRKKVRNRKTNCPWEKQEERLPGGC